MPSFDASFGDIVFWLTTSGVDVAVGIASFRRSRCLSRYPIWQSLIIAVLSAEFAVLWFILWAVNRKDIAAQWRQYRETRDEALVRVSV